MAIHQKKVETFQIILQTGEDEEIKFQDLITHDELLEKELKVKGKMVSLRILQNGRKTIVGLVETSRNENIPPKKNRRNKKIEKLGLTSDEGLVYANVFVYEKQRQILMYEVNKFGCFVEHFKEFIIRCAKDIEDFAALNIELNTVLKANEYQRMMKMRFHKSLEVQLANPTQILNDYRHQNDAIWNLCNTGKSISSQKVQSKFEVAARGNTNGLASRTVKTIVDRALEILRGPNGENVKKIEVVGYETDSEDGGLIPIDLIADRYIQFIELDEPRENTDLLEGQRKQQILELYDKCADDFNSIFGK